MKEWRQANTFNSFWAGGELSPLAWACYSTFAANGCRLLVFTYDTIVLPKGVTPKNAAKIVPKEQLFTALGSYAAFSDIFRMELLRRRGGWWVDADVICLRHVVPSPPSNEYAWEDQDGINGGQLRLVKGSRIAEEALARLYKCDFSNIKRGETGPGLLTEVLTTLNLLGYAKPRDIFYPLHWSEGHKLIFREFGACLSDISKGSSFAHAWGRCFGDHGFDVNKHAPQSGSALDRLYQETGVYNVYSLIEPDWNIIRSTSGEYLALDWVRDAITNADRPSGLILQSKPDHSAVLMDTSPNNDGLKAALSFLKETGSSQVLGLSGLTRKEVEEYRDRIIASATKHFDQDNPSAGSHALYMLEHATIDQYTLDLTDRFIHCISRGRMIIATLDPNRRPRKNEVIIVYGSYPHAFMNVVVNNPIRRPLADFWKFRHDHVEYDARWNGIDRIYIINADNRIDRWDSILRELALAKAPLHRVTRVSACKPHSKELDSKLASQLGCLQSHLKALCLARDDNHDNVLVLEDDFCFTSDIEGHLSDLETFIRRGYDYWVCLVGTSKYGVLVPRDDLLLMSFQPCTNTEGYIVSSEGRERLISIYKTALKGLMATGDLGEYMVDCSWKVLQPSGKFLVFRRKFGYQAASFSNIEQNISRYLD